MKEVLTKLTILVHLQEPCQGVTQELMLCGGPACSYEVFTY
jgi:hypothetical protein